MPVNKERPMRQDVINALEEIGHPHHVRAIILKIYKMTGRKYERPHIASACDALTKKEQIKKWPGDKRNMIAYGLPGQELPEDLDRRKPIEVERDKRGYSSGWGWKGGSL